MFSEYFLSVPKGLDKGIDHCLVLRLIAIPTVHCVFQINSKGQFYLVSVLPVLHYTSEF